MATQYVFTEINLYKDLNLYIDGNSKITVGNGSYDNPKPNALSLPHISTCPGSTPSCRESCYIYGLQKNAPEVYAKYMHNERVIHKVLMSRNCSAVSAFNLGMWIAENCPAGFRWHVSGDIMHDRYATWITMVANHSKVLNWIYTRSLDLVPYLVDNNLVVNVSADADNYEEAREVAVRNKVRICYLSRNGEVPQDLPIDSVIFPDYNLRGRNDTNPTKNVWWETLSLQHRKQVCPGDFFGQSEHHRCGPCKKCLKQFKE